MRPHHLFFFHSIAVVLADEFDLSSVVFGDLDFGDVLLLGHNLLFHLVFLLDSGVMVALLLFILVSLHLGLFGFLVLAQLDSLLHLVLLCGTIIFHIVVSLGNDSLPVSLHLSFIHSLQIKNKTAKLE